MVRADAACLEYAPLERLSSVKQPHRGIAPSVVDAALEIAKERPMILQQRGEWRLVLCALVMTPDHAFCRPAIHANYEVVCKARPSTNDNASYAVMSGCRGVIEM